MQGFPLCRPLLVFRCLVLQPWSQNYDPTSPLSQPSDAAKLVSQWVGSRAAGTTAPRNRDRERATQPSKILPKVSGNSPFSWARNSHPFKNFFLHGLTRHRSVLVVQPSLWFYLLFILVLGKDVI
jgi:hypothetical protein